VAPNYDGPVPEQSPIFVFGVPRSGTTLLRTLLDSHPRIACGPETPWLGGHQPRSVMELVRFLTEDKFGYCASYGRPREEVVAAARRFVSDLMEGYARSKGKEQWAEKTPDNILYIDFLLELFPEAKVLWLVRDGLDVALSTSVVSEERKGISKFLEESLSFGPGVPAVPNTLFNSLLRWRHWNKLAARRLHSRDHLKVSYERLVSEPMATAEQICGFVGVEFDPSMLAYAERPHDYPSWEWGSADVRHHGGIRKDRAGRSRNELSAEQRALLLPLMHGATREKSASAPMTADGSLVARSLEALRTSWRLQSELAVHPDDFGWLWANGLAETRLDNARVYDVSADPSILAWLTALLGARVTTHAADARTIKPLRILADKLQVELDVGRHEASQIKAPDGKADLLLLTGDSIGDGLLREVRRVLKRGGSAWVLGSGGPHAFDNFRRVAGPHGSASILTAA
jgi:protein-tyrosine sulfotransferase